MALPPQEFSVATRPARRITATHRHVLVLTELRGPLLMGMPDADLAPGEDPRMRAKYA
ncbi:hypothetical protein GCM10009608_31420 [Pseudonocardia alaniniphila]